RRVALLGQRDRAPRRGRRVLLDLARLDLLGGDLGGEALLVAHDRVVGDLHVLEAEDDPPVAEVLLLLALRPGRGGEVLGRRARGTEERRGVVEPGRGRDLRIGDEVRVRELLDRLGRRARRDEARAALERRRRLGDGRRRRALGDLGRILVL